MSCGYFVICISIKPHKIHVCKAGVSVSVAYIVYVPTINWDRHFCYFLVEEIMLFCSKQYVRVVTRVF